MTYALITGASKGIGRALSVELAKTSVNLVLVSRNFEALQKHCAFLEKTFRIHCIPIQADLSIRDAPFLLFRRLKHLAIQPEILINNACTYVRGPFKDIDFHKESEIIMMQCLNIPSLTKLFLNQPLLKNEAFILNVASTGGFVPGPFNAIYCAAKSFVLSFTEALSEELKESTIHVSALCPGGTNTTFQEPYERTDSFFNPILEPEQVAKVAIREMFRKKRIIIPGTWNKLQTHLPRILPRKLMTTISRKMTEPQIVSGRMVYK